MNRTGPLDPAIATPDGHVAELLPATAPAPEPARPIPWPVAMLIYWLVPKRIGPHLAAGTFRHALAAHLVALLATGLIVGFWIARTYAAPGESLHDLRVRAAETVLSLAAGSASSPTWVVPALFVGTLLAVELALVLLAMVLMPWCAGGDSAGSVFKRSLKNVYWSTTVWVPTAAAIGWLLAASARDEPWFHRLSDLDVLTVFAAFLAVPATLLLRALLAGASRYVGPPDGPAFAPREPLCDDCGYRITGLPSWSRCPECGLNVDVSLPGGRRSPTPWQQHEFRPRGLLEALRLQWRIPRDPHFFQHLPVQTGLAAARHFWWITFMLMVIALLAAGWASTAVLLACDAADESVVMHQRIILGTWAPSLAFLMHAIKSLAACLWGQLRLGIRDYRVSAVACCYASPLMWPMIAVLVASSLAIPLVARWDRHGARSIHCLGLDWTGPMLCLLAMVAALALALLFWHRRLTRALRCVRHANV